MKPIGWILVLASPFAMVVGFKAGMRRRHIYGITFGLILVGLVLLLAGCDPERMRAASGAFLDGTQQGLSAQRPLYLPPPRQPAGAFCQQIGRTVSCQ